MVAIPEVRSAQHFNALKHGRHAETLLLPGEDGAEFRRRRRAAFHRYRPQTEDEAHLVEAMVEHRWRLERWRPLEAQLDGQAVLPAADVAGRVSEPSAHQRLHSSMDATLHRGRMERLWHRALSRLLALQDQRCKGLIAGAERLPEGCYMETDGQVHGPVAPRVMVPIPEPDIEADRMEVSPSVDGENGKYREQKETGREERTEGKAVASPGYTDAPAGRTGPLRTAWG
jgi:hypothetical protein